MRVIQNVCDLFIVTKCYHPAVDRVDGTIGKVNYEYCKISPVSNWIEHQNGIVWKYHDVYCVSLSGQHWVLWKI